MDNGQFRAMEGAIELAFCDDDGEIDATRQQQHDLLIKEFTEHEVASFLDVYEWDKAGICIG